MRFGSHPPVHGSVGWELTAVWDASSWWQPLVHSFGKLGGGINGDGINWEGVDCGLGRIPPCMVQLAAASMVAASIGRGLFAVGRIPPLAHACPAVLK